MNAAASSPASVDSPPQKSATTIDVGLPIARTEGKRFPWRACLFAAFLYAIAFRPLQLFPVVWIALVPLLISARGKSAGTRFLIGVVFGFFAFAAIDYWIPVAVWNGRWIVGFSATSAVVAAIAGWVSSSALFAFQSGLAGLFGMDDREAPGRLAPLRFACTWTAIEWIRSLGPLGLTWGTSAMSQRPWTTMIQNCDLLGTYGFSFLIALVNAVIAWNIPKAARVAWASSCMMILIASWIRGTVLSSSDTSAIAHGERISVLQPAIPNQEKVNPQFLDSNLRIMEDLSRDAVASGSRLIIWPETMIPRSWSDSQSVRERLNDFAKACNVDLLIGTNEQVNGEGPLYNEAVLMSPDESGYVRKSRLVPFGEYIPLRESIPFLNKVFSGGMDYHAGPLGRPLQTQVGHAGVMICFESTFDATTMSHVRNGADFLVVMTNDDWFRGTSAISDHTDFAVFRAIETRRWLAQAGNSGESFFIAPSGVIVKRLPFAKRAVLTYEIERQNTKTLFVRYGYLFPIICTLIMFGFFVMSANKQRNLR